MILKYTMTGSSREFYGTGTNFFRYRYRYFLPGPNFSGTDLETVNKGDNMLSLFLSGEVRVAFVFIKDQVYLSTVNGRPCCEFPLLIFHGLPLLVTAPLPCLQSGFQGQALPARHGRQS